MSLNKINRHSFKRRFTFCHLSDQINCIKWKVLEANWNNFFLFQRLLKVLNFVRIVLIFTVVIPNSSFKKVCRSKIQITSSCFKLRIQNQKDLRFKALTRRYFRTLIWVILRQQMRFGRIKFQKNKRNRFKRLKFHEAANLSWDQGYRWRGIKSARSFQTHHFKNWRNRKLIKPKAPNLGREISLVMS
jgi:hypothetical protein